LRLLDDPRRAEPIDGDALGGSSIFSLAVGAPPSASAILSKHSRSRRAAPAARERCASDEQTEILPWFIPCDALTHAAIAFRVGAPQ